MRANNETIRQTAVAIEAFTKDPTMAGVLAGDLDRRGLLKPSDPSELDGWRGGVSGVRIEVDENGGWPKVIMELATEGDPVYAELPPVLSRRLGAELIKAAGLAEGDSSADYPTGYVPPANEFRVIRDNY